jgi:acyl CoA:acetate/3-ketoacid CoA transferase beta subunit
VPELSLPPAAARSVSLVVTDLAVLKPIDDGLVLHERAPGVSIEAVVAATTAPLLIQGDVPEMPILAEAQ